MSSLLTLKTFEETFPQVVVDDAALVPRQHRRRSYDVMHGCERLLDPRRELVVRDLRAGVELAF